MPQTIDKFRSSTVGWLRGTLAGWGTMLLCLVGIGFIIVLLKWFGYLAITYELTEERLILHRGIFVKSIDEIELFRVKDIRLDFTLTNQWADLGTITLESSDETTAGRPFVMRDIEHAAARREKMRELINAARRARGVRELDMVQEAAMPAGGDATPLV